MIQTKNFILSSIFLFALAVVSNAGITGAPENLTCTMDGDSFEVSWTAPSSGATNFDKYSVEIECENEVDVTASVDLSTKDCVKIGKVEECDPLDLSAVPDADILETELIDGPAGVPVNFDTDICTAGVKVLHENSTTRNGNNNGKSSSGGQGKHGMAYVVCV